MSRLQLTIATVLVLSVVGPAFAQPGRGGDPSQMADRFFGMMDRNRDGRLDEEETRRIPAPMRDAMQKMGADFRRGISRDRFGEMLPRAMEEMRRGRDSGDGRGGPPVGGDRGRSSYGDRGSSYGDRGDGRGPSDYGRGDDRSRDSRYGSSSRDSRGRSSRSAPKPPPRVTVDLPEAWKAADLDKDGQIGLYEWDRKKYKEFFALDTNRDSLLTPREISRASGPQPPWRRRLFRHRGRLQRRQQSLQHLRREHRSPPSNTMQKVPKVAGRSTSLEDWIKIRTGR